MRLQYITLVLFMVLSISCVHIHARKPTSRCISTPSRPHFHPLVSPFSRDPPASVSIRSAFLFETFRLVQTVPEIAQPNVLNFLYRGGEPRTAPLSHDFAWDTMQFFFWERAYGVVPRFPNEYYVLDISLLDPSHTYQGMDIEMEKTFWEEHPMNGTFYALWTLLGEETNPFDVPAEKRVVMAKNYTEWNVDRLYEHAIEVRELMEGGCLGGSVPCFVYVHCEQGKDRTGELIGAYAMQYMGFTLQKTMQWNEEIAGRKMEQTYWNGLAWYCFYLQQTSIPSIDCTMPTSAFQ